MRQEGDVLWSEIARYCGLEPENPEEAALLERMGPMLEALKSQLAAVRRLDVEGYALRED